MTALLRILLIILLLFLAARAVRALIWPRKNEDRVKGDARKTQPRIDEDRIQDANFKDLPK